MVVVVINWRLKWASGLEMEPGLLVLAQMAVTQVTKLVMHM